MTVKLVVANWKMNKTRPEVARFVEAFAARVESLRELEIALAPAFPFFVDAADPAGRWALAGQNCSSEKAGAWTGEVAAEMLASAGCRYVLVGHSERRKFFGEKEPLLRRKLARAREAGLVPIYCVGESLDEREQGSTWKVLERQMEGLSADPPDRPVVVAYEPVWAIGTGRNASPEEAEEAAEYLGRLLSGRRELRLLYGGSVTPQNTGALAGRREIAGFLVGGASLDPLAFAEICRQAAGATPR